MFLDIHFDVGLTALLVVIPGHWLLLQWMAQTFAYRCPECGELFQLTVLEQFTAVNLGSERNVRCTKYGKRNWMKIVRKGDD